MDRINKIGLPVVLLIMFSVIGLMKSAVNIGYGEAGVLFKTFGEGTVVDEPALSEGFHLILPWSLVREILDLMLLHLDLYKQKRQIN